MLQSPARDPRFGDFPQSPATLQARCAAHPLPPCCPSPVAAAPPIPRSPSRHPSSVVAAPPCHRLIPRRPRPQRAAGSALRGCSPAGGCRPGRLAPPGARRPLPGRPLPPVAGHQCITVLASAGPSSWFVLCISLGVWH
ncbi:hypothetical protein ABZP36_030561 [Zizania latifolia]